jgi:Icc-related predicted phosphoesterase
LTYIYSCVINSILLKVFMLKLAIASDIHLEMGDLNLQNTVGADVLVLAGDIVVAGDLHDHPEPGTPYKPEIIKLLGTRQRKAMEYRDFIKRVSFQFPHVVAIAGNHEFYHGKWIQSIQTLRNEYGKYPNVHFLERDTVTIDGVTFVGGTLWTNLNRGDPMTLHAIQDMMNDYRMIRHDGLGYTKLRPAHTLARHRETLDYFRHVIDDRKDDRIVVVSHMAPSHLSVNERYRHETLMNGAYYSDLSEFILDRPQIAVWFHGHMHDSADYTVGSTRVVSHPRGYVGYERAGQDVDPYYPLLVEV